MDVPVEGWVPESWQGVATFVFAVTVIIASALKYWHSVRKPEPPAVPLDLKVIGAAFNDAHALQKVGEQLEVIAEAARQLRAIRDREAERDIHRWQELTGLLERIAEALEGATGPPRRRA